MPTTKSSTSNEDRERLAVYSEMDEKALLGELLAVLHRDGGQYMALAGPAVATLDAIKVYYDLRSEVAELRFKLRRLEKP